MKPGDKFIAVHKMAVTKFELIEVNNEDPLFPYVLLGYEIQMPGGQWVPCQFIDHMTYKWFNRSRRIIEFL